MFNGNANAKLTARSRPLQKLLTHSRIERTAMPLGPLAMNGRESSTQAMPAMSRWIQGVSSAKWCRNSAAVIAPPKRPPVFLRTQLSFGRERASRVVTAPQGKEKRPPVLPPSLKRTIDYRDQSAVSFLARSHPATSWMPNGNSSSRTSACCPRRPASASTASATSSTARTGSSAAAGAQPAQFSHSTADVTPLQLSASRCSSSAGW